MANKKQPLLKAVEHNWGLMGPGDWSEVRWRIFYDGSYEVISTFNPSFESFEKNEEMLKRHAQAIAAPVCVVTFINTDQALTSNDC